MAMLNPTCASGWLAGCLLVTATLACGGARAASDCGLGLTPGTAPQIDGLESAGEWSDASIMTSASPCFQPLKDHVAGTYPDRPLAVKSKRYQRNGTWFLGFLFAVQDQSSTGPCAGGMLCIGERIVMQFNRTINGDDKLNTTQDRRFSLVHRWVTPATPPAGCSGGNTGDCVASEIASLDDSTVQPAQADAACVGATGVDTRWGDRATLSGIAHVIRKDLVGGGYRVELEVPVSFVTGVATDPTADIGVAFAVINDFGTNSFGGPPDFNCAPGGTCEGAGASFPSTLPENNDENPVGAICDKGWVVPKAWGVGYLASPPSQVTISRGPVHWWDSDGIQVFECNAATPSYTYYSQQPCRLRVNAILRNNGATARRKVAFLWARHGSGDPLEYNFIDLKEAVLTAGTPTTLATTTIPSDLWSGMPKNEANHPCLRVYILPETLSSADETALRGTGPMKVVTKAVLDAVVGNNNVQEQHWAQKNISRHGTQTLCPNAECRVASLMLPGGDLALIGAAHAQATMTEATTKGALLNSADWRLFAADHVIVRARAVAYRLPRGGKPLYSLIEDFGGVVQLFPMAMVKEKRSLPLEFQVSNGSASRMRVKILTDVHLPPGAEGVKLELAQADLTLDPGSVTDVKATLVNPAGPAETGQSVCSRLTKSLGLALGGGVFLVGLAGLGSRRSGGG